MLKRHAATKALAAIVDLNQRTLAFKAVAGAFRHVCMIAGTGAASVGALYAAISEFEALANAEAMSWSLLAELRAMSNTAKRALTEAGAPLW